MRSPLGTTGQPGEPPGRRESRALTGATASTAALAVAPAATLGAGAVPRHQGPADDLRVA